MAKKSTTVKVVGIKKGDLFVNEAKVNGLVRDMDAQLAILCDSLSKVSVSMNKLVNQNVIKESKATTYKNFIKKAKAQATAAKKLRDTLASSYDKDLQFYPIRLLDERIALLEKKIASLED